MAGNDGTIFWNESRFYFDKWKRTSWRDRSKLTYTQCGGNVIFILNVTLKRIIYHYVETIEKVFRRLIKRRRICRDEYNADYTNTR